MAAALGCCQGSCLLEGIQPALLLFSWLSVWLTFFPPWYSSVCFPCLLWPWLGLTGFSRGLLCADGWVSDIAVTGTCVGEMTFHGKQNLCSMWPGPPSLLVLRENSRPQEWEGVSLTPLRAGLAHSLPAGGSCSCPGHALSSWQTLLFEN